MAAARKEFQELEEQGIVRRSASHWATPLHMVKKADNTWRPCGDFRQLNLQTRPDRYTCPNIADFSSRLAGKKVFSVLDLRKGYHQVPVRAEDVHKTAVITPFGLYEYLRMPFGLRNAGNTFQRMMDEVLAGLESTFCYMDDGLVASVDGEEHVRDLEEVLKRLEAHGLVLNGEKCVLGQEEVTYLGHRVSASGISPLLTRVQAISTFPRPESVKQLMQYLGMVNFYRRFLPGAAKLLKPLTDALRGGKNSKLLWTPEMDQSFLDSKKRLADVAQLAHPKATGKLVLSVDASDAHVGAALQQRDDRGALEPLGFFSRKLDSAQRKYSTFDRELLACYLAIRHFRWMLEGREFVVYTDHKPLTYALHRTTDAWSARQQRHLSYIAEYTSEIKHVAGTENVVADALSRPAAAVLPSEGGSVKLADLAQAQATCESVQSMVGKPHVQHVQVQGLQLWCEVSDGVLKPLVPADWRRKVFDNIHGLAHPGVRATRRMITSRYAWPGCSKEVEAWCRDCQQCGRGKIGVQEKPPLQPIDIPSRAFSHVHVDLVGPLPASTEGHSYLLTIVDRTTRWPEVVALKSISAQVVVDSFVNTWVARYGVPTTVTTDRGTQFSGAVWQCLCKTLGIQHIMTTSYHPQGNGLVERFHRSLKAALRARCDRGLWWDHLPWALLGLRAAPKEEAKVSAAEAAFGIPLRLPGQVLEQHVPVDRPKIPSTLRTYADVAAGRESSQLEWAYVREGQAKTPLAPAYAGPYRVLRRGDKATLLQIGDREEWVAPGRLKPHVGAADVVPAQPPKRGRPKRATEDSGIDE
ncbi:MAG: DDE-type integrase/transposase/recombinase [Sphingomonadales bacterium]|nr:DDE-type integrase/transposase/recombinase [Sphingomonadales bacterium]